MPNDPLPPVTQTDNAPTQTPESLLSNQPAAPTDWRASLPTEIRDLPTLGKFKDVSGLAQSYAELERRFSQSGKVAIPAADAPPEAWKDVFKALGRPDEPSGYELKAPEGAPIQAEVLPEYAKAAHEAGLSKAQAAKLVEWFGGHAKQQADSIQQQQAQAMEQGVATLRQEWGKDFDTYAAAAQRAVRLYGGEELIQVLNATGMGGNPAVVKAFANIGKLAQEHGLPAGSGVPGTMTKEMAQARINEMQSDPETIKALTDPMHPRHQLARQERHNLRLQAQGA